MKYFKLSIIIFFSFFVQVTFGQKDRIAKLPKYLKEISGLIFYNDTLLIAHNDGGDDPLIYLINLKGEEIHRVLIENATNIDWEDITSDDKGNLYIADIGNNENGRKDLCIYKINSKHLLKKEKIKAEKINISYSEQKDFPAEEKDKHFDAEGIAYYNDSLYIFTKCRSMPWDGKSFCYTVSTKPGTYKLTKKFDLYIGKNGWWKDAVTGAEIKNNKCYLLTYNRLIVFSINEGKFNFDKKILLEPISQNESVTVNSKGVIYMADEKNKLLGGGNLYIIKEPKQKKKK
jgi:hypothetical protein